MKKNGFSNSVFITGANRGMGLGFVKHFLQLGNNVVATVRNPNTASDLQLLEKDYPGRLLILSLDVKDEKSIKNLTAKLEENQISITTAINNAGISKEQRFGEWTTQMFNEHLQVNLIGPALVAQILAPFLQAESKLVQITSGMGSLELNINPENALDAYAVSKCALNSITRRLAAKLRNNNIIVFCLNPGWVKTTMGGTDALVSIEEAVNNMVKTIEKVKMDDAGSFLSDKGEVIPW